MPYGIDPKGMGFYWPESEQKRSEVLIIKRSSPDVFEATYQCRPGSRQGSIFLADDLDSFYQCLVRGVQFSPSELALGMPSPYVRDFVSQGHCVLQAWDTAFSTSLQAAHTVCVTALIVPCQAYHRGENPAIVGPCDYHFDVLILDVFRRRVDWGGLVNAAKTLYQLWRPQEVLIEKKASGISLIQSLESSGIPIVPMPATASKGARAVNSVTLKTAGSVQGWFRQHRVLSPTYAPWLEAWRTELKDFSGNDDASSDQVDATVHLVTRAIIMGSGMVHLPADWAPERSQLPGYLAASQSSQPLATDPRALMLSAIGDLVNQSEDPYWGTCARCVHDGQKFCTIQGRRMLALDSCDSYADDLPTDVNLLSEAMRK
jgi:predicted phage terminase large subunit-like protein